MSTVGEEIVRAHELKKAVFETAEALHRRWGSTQIGDYKIVHGCVYPTTDYSVIAVATGIAVLIVRKNAGCGKFYGLPETEDTFEIFQYNAGFEADYVRSADVLNQIALLAASHDFVNKIEGSISRLKAVTRAISG